VHLPLMQVLELPDAVFQLYMAHLSSHAFANRAVPEELEELRRSGGGWLMEWGWV
jgi:hypothetical protein